MNRFLIKISAAFAAAFLLTGCFQDLGVAPTPLEPSIRVEESSMRIRMRLAAVNSLSKGNAISLSKVIVVLTSNASPADTIRDTITPGEQGFSSNPLNAQTIDSNYSVKGLRIWKIKVSVRDTKDSLIHVDSATTPKLGVADQAIVNLGLTSRFSMYDAKFVSLPDSISSTTGNLKQVLRINRLVLKVDGVIVRDSIASPGPWFAPGTEHVLSYDYVGIKAGGRTIEMLAYGPMGSWNVADPLYSGSQVVNPTAGVNLDVSVTLNWVGPTTGGGSITATLSKVGKVTITGKLPGTP